VEFRILSDIRDIEVIARGAGVMERRRLRKAYGTGRWRKLKGIATVELLDGTIWTAEVHWYEAHGIGKKEIKLKRKLEDSGW
jgi:hypothetical protein